jgi:hypothetical protein
MPGLDKTGPRGEGPTTGRGLGPCGSGLAWRRGCGMGRGLGRYFGWNWPQNKEDQKKALVDYKKALEEELEDVKKEEEDLK